MNEIDLGGFLVLLFFVIGLPAGWLAFRQLFHKGKKNESK